jgi:8-oxo-dGTP diphosphatase
VIRYVLGFRFDGDRVLLLQKARPAWMAGMLNGVGGKIEPGETPLDAMRREFFEETGLVAHDWQPVAVLEGANGYEMHVFASEGPIDGARSVTDEPLYVAAPWHTEGSSLRKLPNMQWLLAMSRQLLRSPGQPYKITDGPIPH